MTMRSTAVASLVLAVAAVGACGSNTDDEPGAAGAAGSSASAGAGNSAGGAGAGHGGSGGLPAAGGTVGGAGTSGGNANGHAGSGGSPNAGAPGGGAAGAGDESGVAGEDGVGLGGQAGAASEGPQEYAYLTTFLGGIFALKLNGVSGKPDLLSGSPIDVGAQIYAVGVGKGQRLLYVLDFLHKLDTYVINADGTLPTKAAFSTPIDGGPVTLALDPKGRFAYVGTRTDDNKTFIDIFKIDATTGALTSAGDPLQVGGAPAYVALDPTGNFAYVTQSTGVGLFGYRVDQNSGLLSPIDTSPYDTTLVFGGAIAFEPNGKFLFTAGGGLRAFGIDAASGKLQQVEGSPFSTDVSSDPTATNIALDPSGKFLYATQFLGTQRVFGFSVAPDSGKLLPVPGPPTPVSEPYSVAVDPSGRFVYVGQDDGAVSAFSINRSNGTLNKVEGSPFPHGGLQPEFAFTVP